MKKIVLVLMLIFVFASSVFANGVDLENAEVGDEIAPGTTYIGGADGPTDIYIKEDNTRKYITVGAVAIIVIAGAAYFIKKK